MNDWTFLQEAIVSPNPSFGMFNLNVAGALGDDIIINIYDAQARLVWSQTMSQAWGMVQTPIDLSGMSGGVYQLELMSAGARHTLQVMKQ